VRDVACELGEGNAPCGQLPLEFGGWEEDKVRSCADIECGEICDEGFGERWCEVGQWRRGKIHGGSCMQTQVGVVIAARIRRDDEGIGYECTEKLHKYTKNGKVNTPYIALLVALLLTHSTSPPFITALEIRTGHSSSL